MTYGPALNFKAGKTEFAIFLAGSCMVAARAQFLGAPPLVGGVPVLRLAVGRQHLRVTTTVACSFGPELEARLAGGTDGDGSPVAALARASSPAAQGPTLPLLRLPLGSCTVLAFGAA